MASVEAGASGPLLRLLHHLVSHFFVLSLPPSHHTDDALFLCIIKLTEESEDLIFPVDVSVWTRCVIFFVAVVSNLFTW